MRKLNDWPSKPLCFSRIKLKALRTNKMLFICTPLLNSSHLCKNLEEYLFLQYNMILSQNDKNEIIFNKTNPLENSEASGQATQIEYFQKYTSMMPHKTQLRSSMHKFQNLRENKESAY